MAWRFEPGEGLRKAFRRVSAEEIAKVRAGLNGPEADRDKAIHEARQAFKRLRALVRACQAAARLGFRRREPAVAGRGPAALRLARYDGAPSKLRQARGRSRAASFRRNAVKRLRARIAANGAKNGGRGHRGKATPRF